MKKFFAGLITGLLISISVTAFAAVQLKVVPNPFPVFINGDQAQVDAYNINGSTFLKLADLKQTGLDVKFADSKINVLSTFAATDPTDYTVPEIDNSNNYVNPKILFDGDNFTLTTYKDLKALKYNGKTYVSSFSLYKLKNIKTKIPGKNGIRQLYLNNQLILETTDANPINYVSYNGDTYFNINFIGKYLGN
jgi:glycerophosphoryl diester phosphodiesterase